MKIVLCSGCFDPCHIGHLWHLLQAREMGDKLIVSVTEDAGVRAEKGEKRPVFPQEQRAQFIGQFRCVDGVIVVRDSFDALQKVKPTIFVKGSEYRKRISDRDAEFCKTHGIEIRFTDGPVYSSTLFLKYYEPRRR